MSIVIQPEYDQPVQIGDHSKTATEWIALASYAEKARGLLECVEREWPEVKGENSGLLWQVRSLLGMNPDPDTGKCVHETDHQSAGKALAAERDVMAQAGSHHQSCTQSPTPRTDEAVARDMRDPANWANLARELERDAADWRARFDGKVAYMRETEATRHQVCRKPAVQSTTESSTESRRAPSPEGGAPGASHERGSNDTTGTAGVAPGLSSPETRTKAEAGAMAAALLREVVGPAGTKDASGVRWVAEPLLGRIRSFLKDEFVACTKQEGE